MNDRNRALGRIGRAFHFDLVEVRAAISAAGIRALLDMLDRDPVAVVLRCSHCGGVSMAPAGRDYWTGRSFAQVFHQRHAGCSRAGEVKAA